MPHSPANYLPLNGRLKVRESELASDSDIERIVDSPDMEHVMRVLADLHVADQVDVSELKSISELEPAFDKHLTEAFQVIEESAPDEALVHLLRARFEWHNVKSIAKSLAAKEDPEKGPLSDIGILPIDQIQTALETDQEVSLPENVLKTIQDIKATGMEDPRQIDLLADAALARDWKQLASESGNKHIKELIDMMCDLQNLRNFVRLVAMQSDVELAEMVLVSAPTLQKKRLLEILSEGDDAAAKLEKLSERAKTLPGFDAISEGLEQATEENNFSELEKAIDDALILYTKEGRNEMFGVLPALGFFLGKERELMNLRIALTGKQFGIPREDIVNRLRILY